MMNVDVMLMMAPDEASRGSLSHRHLRKVNNKRGPNSNGALVSWFDLIGSASLVRGVTDNSESSTTTQMLLQSSSSR